ncbi:MAG: TonB-dependent receptor [Marinilabiliaceae bacterium]|nr:TonB-dependent receptor [Marinilabiliaceae bacterium]
MNKNYAKCGFFMRNHIFKLFRLRRYQCSILLFFALLCSFSGYSQQSSGTVTGHINDDIGEPIPGVSVSVKGSTTGTITDVDGNYTISNIKPTDVLFFSFVGMESQEILVGNKTKIDVMLTSEVIGLNEVVAIGYGTMKKRDLTGAVASVDRERLSDIPSTNLTSSLQGSVAGVSISTPYGTPGEGSSILIRGLNSMKASNNPLVVIDGIPGGSIDDIDPNDIESIDVLKDAASTSIYGSRGTNGVILITTKSGEKGDVKFAYSGYYGVSTPANKVDLLSVDQYIDKRYEMYRISNGLSLNEVNELTVDQVLGVGNELDMYNMDKSYNWQEELFQPAPITGHNLSVSGGNEKTQYYLSLNILDQTGLIKNSGFGRQSARANISSDVKEWFRIGTNLFVTRSEQDKIRDGIFSSAFQISPLGKMYNDEETKEQYTLYPMDPDTYIANPFTELEIKNQIVKTRLMNSSFIEISFLNDFKYKVTANTILNFDDNKKFTPFYTKQVEAFDKYESASIDRNHSIFLNMEHLLSFNKKIGAHNVGATLVFATEDYKKEGLYAYSKNFGTDYYGWTSLDLGDVTTFDMSSSEEKTFLESFIGRANYSFKGKYLAQFTVRRDRSSKFVDGKRDAIFPGGSLGWRISDEPFVNHYKFIDNLKLRVSYAQTGNEGIGYRSVYNTGKIVYYTTGQDESGTIISGLVQSSLANKDLEWEKSEQSNIGLDFSLFKGKMSGVIEAYNTKTTDLLLSRDISSMTGFTSMLTNVGSINNKGIEIALNSNVMNTPDFNWTISTTFTTNKNEIVDLYGDGKDDYSNNWFIGEPVGAIYDYVFDGVLQPGETAPEYMDNLVGIVGDGKNIVPGEVKVKDVGGWETLEDGSTVRTTTPDGKIDDADKKIIGQKQPKWIGSLSMQFNYKNFDFSFVINHVQGTLRRVPGLLGDRTHYLDLPYYTDENPSGQYGRPIWSSTIDGLKRNGNQFGYLSYYQDGTYTRLQNVTLGYSVPKPILSKIGIDQVRFYVTGQNLITFTDYIGYDPSLNYTDNQTNAEIDRLAGYPTTRNWIFGVKVNF